MRCHERPLAAELGAFVRMVKLSNTGHSTVWLKGTLPVMTRKMEIARVEQDVDDGLIVTFSDGTTAGYVIEELLELGPCRLTLGSEAKRPNLPQIP
jgi:hypothetical protein